MLKSKNQTSGGKLSRPRARPRSGSAAEEPRVRPIWSSSSIEKRAMAPCMPVWKAEGWIRSPLGMNTGSFGCQAWVTVSRSIRAAAMSTTRLPPAIGRGRQEGGIVADAVVGPGADAHSRPRSGPGSTPAEIRRQPYAAQAAGSRLVGSGSAVMRRPAPPSSRWAPQLRRAACSGSLWAPRERAAVAGDPQSLR